MVHIVMSIVLILIVLLQAGKGADVSAAFGGGSSHTVFGSRGAGTFLSRLTAAAAIIFMLTSLSPCISIKGADSLFSGGYDETEGVTNSPC